VRPFLTRLVALPLGRIIMQGLVLNAMATGGLVALVTGDVDTADTAHEAIEWLSRSDRLESIVTGTMLRFADAITTITFHIPFVGPGCSPPMGYPFCFLRRISFELGIYFASRGGPIVLSWTGHHLWCLVQALPTARRTALLRAARQGWVVFQIGDLLPCVAFQGGGWAVEWDSEAYQQFVTERQIMFKTWLSDRTLPDLAHVVKAYQDQPSILRLQVSQVYVFANPEQRRSLVFRDTFNPVRTFHHEVRLGGDVGQRLIVLNFPSAASLFELHALVERGDRPYTFYAPEEQPVVDLSLWSHRRPLPYRFSVDSNDHLAHYVVTFARWHYVTVDTGRDEVVKQCLQPEGPPLPASGLEVRVQLSPQLRFQDQLHLWAVGYEDGLML